MLFEASIITKDGQMIKKKWLLDSGSERTIVTKRIQEKCGAKLHSTDVLLRVANNNIVQPLGYCELLLDLPGRRTLAKITAIVVDEEGFTTTPILGMDTFKKYYGKLSATPDDIYITFKQKKSKGRAEGKEREIIVTSVKDAKTKRKTRM